MDITVYLPDDLGKRAKDRNFPLSQMLRAAVVARIEEEDAVEATLKGATPVKLVLEDHEGRTYTGRITAERIAEDGDFEVFLTDEQNVVVYDGGKLQYWVVQDPQEELPNCLGTEALIGALDALGLQAEVDLGV